jgi:hypothetical protein
VNVNDYAVIWPADSAAAEPDIEVSTPTRVWVDEAGGLQAEWVGPCGGTYDTVEMLAAVVPLDWDEEQTRPVIDALASVARTVAFGYRVFGFDPQKV